MNFRVANTSDIPALFSVRMSVKENILVTPDLVTDELCAEYLTERGKGWVCEIDDLIVGFAIADVQEGSIWALFIKPEYEHMGIGRELHNIMLDWYFKEGKKNAWLTTAPNTRAERFYRTAGWKENGRNKNGEIRFELTPDTWKK